MEKPEERVTISKKTLYGIIVGIIIIFAGILIYLNTSRPSSPTYNVKIISFAKEEGYLVGETMVFPFTIEVENLGSSDVSGLDVVVKVLGDRTELDSDTTHLSTLRVGHSLRISATCYVNENNLLGKDISYVATVYLGNAVLDESTLP